MVEVSVMARVVQRFPVVPMVQVIRLVREVQVIRLVRVVQVVRWSGGKSGQSG